MGHDVLVKRCGCGALLKAREGCARCADAARARLHAAGYCRTDGTGQPYDCGKPPLGKRPEWLDWRMRSPEAKRRDTDRLNDAVRSGELVLRSGLDRAVEQLSKLAYKHEPPPVGAEVPWSVAKADMQRRPEARYRPQSVFGVEYAVQNVLSYSLIRKGGSGRWERSVMQDADAEQARWVKLA